MFSLTNEQRIKLQEWISSKKEVYCGAIGGRFTYQFTPTSIGIVVKVIDEIDNSEIDLSDYDEW